MSILIFLLVLFVLVLVHEWGHFIVAKKTGMRVDEFGIGFPPKLFGIKRGETEYTFNALPIGGFVKIYGEDSVGISDTPESSRSFIAKSKWAQAAVLVAGVLMNVLFAWFLFFIALMVGVQTAVEESTASPEADLVITEVITGSPAAQAGITPGIRVTGVEAGGESLDDLKPQAFSAFTTQNADQEVTVTYLRGDSEQQAVLVPESGVLEGEPDRVAIGVALAMVDVVSRPVHIAFWESFVLTLTSLRDIAIGISALLWDAVQFDADLSNVAGPVGIVGLVGEASAFGFTALLMFTAFISLNLAIINMLPFPALDGGRLLFVIIESIKGSPINPKYVHGLNTLGFVLLILLMIAITYNDIVRII